MRIKAAAVSGTRNATTGTAERPVSAVRVDRIRDEREKTVVRNALAGYARKIRSNEAIALIDTSIQQDGSEGLALAKEGFAFSTAGGWEYLGYDEIVGIKLSADQKRLTFVGEFHDRQNDSSYPFIAGDWYDLEALAVCITEILRHAPGCRVNT